MSFNEDIYKPTTASLVAREDQVWKNGFYVNCVIGMLYLIIPFSSLILDFGLIEELLGYIIFLPSGNVGLTLDSFYIFFLGPTFLYLGYIFVAKCFNRFKPELKFRASPLSLYIYFSVLTLFFWFILFLYNEGGLMEYVPMVARHLIGYTIAFGAALGFEKYVITKKSTRNSEQWP